MDRRRRSVIVLQLCYSVVAVSLALGNPPAFSQISEDWTAEHISTHTSIKVVADSNGNIYTLGNDQGDYLVIKHDPSGNEQWTARYDRAGRDDTAYDFAIDPSGNVYVTGASVDAAWDTGYATIKIGPNGVLAWAAVYNEPSGQEDRALAVDVDTSGNVYVTGVSGLVAATVKYNSDGKPLWAARTNGFYEVGNDVRVDTTGNVYVTGRGQDGIKTLKYDANGALVWKTAYTRAYDYAGGTGIEVDGSGNVYVVGWSMASVGSPSDFAALKYGNNGQLQWVSFYNGPGNGSDLPCSVSSSSTPCRFAVDNSGNVYITGQSLNAKKQLAPTTIKYDTNGNPLWVARMDDLGDPYGSSRALAVDPAGNVYITGKASGSAITAKYDTHGNLQWHAACCTGTTTNDAGWDIALDHEQGIIVSGSSEARGMLTIKYGQKINHPPTANSGQDLTMGEGSMVTLDGSASSDPDGDPLQYDWTQIAGTPVALDLTDPAHPIFQAPSVASDGGSMTFQLTVDDGMLTSEPDIVNVTVMDVNHAPVSEAGNDQTVQEGSAVTLDGSLSYDPDGQPLTIGWTQTGGPPVELSSSDDARPSFTAPTVGPGGETLVFELTVSDGMVSAQDTVSVVVENVNHAPLADAGADQTKSEGGLVQLDGSASRDPDGDLLSFHWTQILGSPAVLSDPTTAAPSFTAPPVGPGGELLVFQLVVGDGPAQSPADQVAITVQNLDDPPSCSLATADPTLLWPPDHKLTEVAIRGVSDPENDEVTVTVTSVTQDEPTNGLGDGDTGPDAVIQSGTLLLRAERSGNGNGRVYEVNFLADDGKGGSCGGSVWVGVPKSKGKDAAEDDGQSYDSTQP
jgi:hypothetical protein